MVGLLATGLVFVLVHNTATVPETVLNDARRIVQRIYGDCGVTIVWSAPGDSPGLTIHVTLRRQPGGGPGVGAPSATGTTIRDDRSPGGVSLVFYQRVLNLAHRYQQPTNLMLAYVIAHEMGHVLLPAPAHTSSGLMKSEWDGDDIRRFAAGDMLFTAKQQSDMKRLVDCLPHGEGCQR